ncbi:EAL domain-containing protein [Acidovorax sp. DW039]|uniref:sensor domain-containing protein n=1 Tax=Acidovorax sp. DW039 TaxID=3095606 RepID=UPI00308FD4F3|nr:EAL domain-containing protein [Acidovorax sp. DW039]
MTALLLLAGGLLALIVVTLVWLEPEQVLHPSLRSQVIAGVVGGFVSALLLVTLRASEPNLGVVVHPTATAFLGLYFGPVAATLTAAIALIAQLWIPEAPWAAVASVLAAAWLLGAAGRWHARRAQGAVVPWLAMSAVAVLLPVLTYACMVLTGEWPLPEDALHAFSLMPWHHGGGIVLLGTGRHLIAARAQAARALRNAHNALAEREEQLRLAMESLNGGRWEWDVRSRKFHCEGQFYQAFGIDNVHAPDLWQLWYGKRHPADVERTAAYLARAMNGLEESYEAEFRVKNTAGEWRWIMSRGTVAERDAEGRPVRLAGMDVDITAHHDVEDALRASEAKSSTIYLTLPDPAGITAMRDGRMLEANPAFCELVGLPRDQILGRTAEELHLWARPGEHARLLNTVLRDGQAHQLPMLARRHDGAMVSGLMSARPVQMDGQQGMVFVFHDMTEAERTSDELKARNSLLQQAGRLARLGAWEHDVDRGLVYWSDMCFEIHGLALGSPLPTHDYIQRYVAEEYREEVLEKFRSTIYHQQEWSMEVEIVRADGRRLWVRSRAEPVLENGQVTRVRGVMQDIDEAYRARLRLKQSEERFSRIFQLMPFPMGLSRCRDGQYMEINPAWEEMIGISRSEMLGRNSVEMGIFKAEDRANLIRAAEPTGQLNSYEVTIYPRNSPPRTVLQSMRMTDFDGEPCWMFSVQDITDRKRNEEKIREREELLSLTISAASLGLWDWDLKTGTITGDSRWRALRGPVGDAPAAAPDAQSNAQPIEWTQTVSADDVDRITAEIARHASHHATPFDATWRMKGNGSSPRWVRNLGKIVSFDARGIPQRMLGVAIDVTPQREQEVLLQKLAHYDALTGLPNRVLLARKLQEAMALASANQKLLGVAYLDLDGFKPVNDRFGHGAGDRLLMAVAGRLSRALRPQDCVARLGGDEFVILLPDLESPAECEGRLHRVMDSVASPYPLDSERVVVTASIGYTLYPSDDADADALLRHADQAMYAAKQAGRNRFHMFDAVQDRALQLLREQAKHLRNALDEAQFTLYLQPKVDMRTGALVGAEALVRWQHPERGLLTPGDFLPLIEGTELHVVFGQWVMEAAFTTLEQLQALQTPLPVSVNVGAQHLQQEGFAEWMQQVLTRHPQVSGHLVEIEITESAALYDLHAVTTTLQALRALGVSVSLDDFGTGYSSLTYLRRLPMDTLKIDQSFVHGMMHDPGDLAIVQGVIGLARSFGYRVIAEGVETLEQGQMLMQLGCTQAQGFAIGRPMPLRDFIQWSQAWQAPEEWRRYQRG